MIKTIFAILFISLGVVSCSNEADAKPQPGDHIGIRYNVDMTCSHCGHTETMPMPENKKQMTFKCPWCKDVLKPVGDDCCVFCTYGDVKCPTKQLEGK